MYCAGVFLATLAYGLLVWCNHGDELPPNSPVLTRDLAVYRPRVHKHRLFLPLPGEYEPLVLDPTLVAANEVKASKNVSVERLVRTVFSANLDFTALEFRDKCMVLLASERFSQRICDLATKHGCRFAYLKVRNEHLAPYLDLATLKEAQKAMLDGKPKARRDHDIVFLDVMASDDAPLDLALVAYYSFHPRVNLRTTPFYRAYTRL